jgi:uncharacterized protein YehS (DUF1456 family)
MEWIKIKQKMSITVSKCKQKMMRMANHKDQIQCEDQKLKEVLICLWLPRTQSKNSSLKIR